MTLPADAATPASSVDQMLRWKGRPFENAAGGVYDMRARWWSPAAGQFLTADRFRYFDATSTLWGWANQSPLRWSDPSGKLPVAPIPPVGPQLTLIPGGLGAPGAGGAGALGVGALALVDVAVLAALAYEVNGLINDLNPPTITGGPTPAPNPTGSPLATPGAQSCPSSSPDRDAGKPIPIVTFDYNKTPNLADNIWHAQQARHDDLLHYNGGSPTSDFMRDFALDDHDGVVDVPSGYERDEYPFASTIEGGPGAWVGLIPKGEQRAQGAILGNFYRSQNLGPGDPFIVRVINHP